MEVVAGKYKIVSKIGEGATGTVYLVEHADLNVPYALKILNRELSSNQALIENFKKEAALLLRFSHPGSVQLRDFGKTEDGLYYMAMDYCFGVPLTDRLEYYGALPLDRALAIIIQVLQVLEAAHSQGIIHRDIKSDNLMVVEDGEGNETVRVLDFGIAVLHVSDGDSQSATVGTPEYMAPELIAGEKQIDHRIDIYSSGVVLYEMLTGKVPFKADDLLETLLMQITKAPPPFSPELNLPKRAEEIVVKAMQKNRENRFKSAATFRLACSQLLEDLKSSSSIEEKCLIPEVESESLQEIKQPDSIEILCLDDDLMLLNLMKHILQKEGYRVHTVSDCGELHNYLKTHKVQLLLSDVQMPGIPGTRVCHILKQTMKDLKIVLFSNIPERELEASSKASKADDWISKNWMPSEWIRKIQEVLKA